jgi:hypothetical protein
MNSKRIEVKNSNFREANREVVINIINLLGVDIPEGARAKGMTYEQPCRLERVPVLKLKEMFDDEFENQIVYLDICTNP